MEMRDLNHAARVAAKRPGFALAVVLTLGLGIGANTAVFTLINTVVLRPLPYAEAQRLYTLLELDSLGTARRLASYPTFLDWHEQADVFHGSAFVSGTGLRYQHEGQAGMLLGAFVSEEFFPTLGVPATLGRALLSDDYLAGNKVAVLSHRLWRSLGGDPAVVGRTLVLGDEPFTVIGVMPPGFAYPDWGVANDLWSPIDALPPADMAALMQRGFHADSRVLARLAPGVSLPQAQAQMDAIARRLAAAYPEMSARWTRVSIESLTDITIGSVRTRLFLLGAAVAVVLLICCVNLANLYLAQGAARSPEFAIRAALGAGRRRIVRQLLAESLLLAVLGGALGTIAATWAVHLVRVRDPLSLPRMSELTIDLRVLGFAAAITVLTAALFAAAGARRAASPHLSAALTERAGAGMAGGRRGNLPAWLLSVQVAMTVVLLAGAALLTRSLWRLSQVDPGFDPVRLVAMWIMPPSPRYDEAEAAVQLYDRVADAVRAVPGVERVAMINHAPVGRGGLPSGAAIGQAPAGTADDIPVLFLTVSAGYFATMGIPVLSGREFNEADIRGPPGPLIVNQTLARRWGERSPLGDRLGVLKAARTRPDFGEPLLGTVVGVVGDVRHFGLDAGDPPMVYVPYTHNPWASMTLLARSAGPPDNLLAAVERAVRQVDPAIPLEPPHFGLGARTMETRVRDSYGTRRLNALMIGAFALTALLLAAIGIYGVTAYSVALETREIGIRIALGAAPSSVLRGVVRQVALITLAGMGAGLAAALALSRLISSLLYEVPATDPLTYAVAGLILLAVAVFAAYLPARRASTIDPVAALRAG